MPAAHRREGSRPPTGCSAFASASRAGATRRPLMCTSNLPLGRARSNRQRARAQARESRRRRERRPLLAQVWAPAQRAGQALRPRVGEWAPALGREVGRRRLGLEAGAGAGWGAGAGEGEGTEAGRARRGRRRGRSAKVWGYFGFRRRMQGLIEGGWWLDHRRGFRPGLCRRRRRRGDRRRGRVGCRGLHKALRLGWGCLFCGGGRAPIAAANPHQAVLPIRRAMLPILASRLGQVKETVDVSRETIAQNVRSRGYTLGQRA